MNVCRAVTAAQSSLSLASSTSARRCPFAVVLLTTASATPNNNNTKRRAVAHIVPTVPLTYRQRLRQRQRQRQRPPHQHHRHIFTGTTANITTARTFVTAGMATQPMQCDSACGMLAAGAVTPGEARSLIATQKVKTWLYLAAPDTDRDTMKAEVDAAAGVTWKELHFDMSNLSHDFTKELIATLSTLEQPSVLQCASGARAGAAVVLALASQRKYPAQTALSLAADLKLESFLGKQPLVDYVQKTLSDLYGEELCSQSQTEHVIFRQLKDGDSSTLTYILGCPETKKAVIIDPVDICVDRDLEMVDSMGLELLYALNTHCHADHITGTGLIKQKRPEVKSVIAKKSGARADVYVSDGDTVGFGQLQLVVKETPGHTDGCVTYECKGVGLFTGDALLIRGCGRTDFQQGSADTLYDSVHSKILNASDDTILYPAHDYKGRAATTVGEEKVLNLRLTKPKSDFVELMNNLGLSYPKHIDRALPANLVCGIQD